MKGVLHSRPSQLIYSCVLACLLVACSQEPPAAAIQLTGRTMGTSYSVQIDRLPAAISVHQLQQELDQLLQQFNTEFSTYDEHSAISRFNRAEANVWFPVSSRFPELLEIARAINKASNGALDITVQPLVQLWGFGPDIVLDKPATEDIADAQALVGFQLLEWQQQPPAIRKSRAGVQIDLSAIAKGYAVDQLADVLQRHQIANYLVEIGGELRGQGHNADGDPWQIGIQTPDSSSRQASTVLNVQDQGIATSGDYLNYFEENGQRYSHLLDPRTGYPITHQTASVTVIAATATAADGWATALLVAGAEQGLRLAEQHDLAALFLIRSNTGFVQLASPAMLRNQPHLSARIELQE